MGEEFWVFSCSFCKSGYDAFLVENKCILMSINEQEKHMGRGDKKTKKGKIWRGSFGKSRPVNHPKKTQPEKKPS
jgi:30S ribosomal protein S31